MSEEEMAERICQLEKELRKIKNKYKLLYDEYIQICGKCSLNKKKEFEPKSL